MERQRDKNEDSSKEVQKTTEKVKGEELEGLKLELQRLRELKRQKELKELEIAKEREKTLEKEEIKEDEKAKEDLKDLESRLNDIDTFLLKQFELIDTGTYEDSSEIETQMKVLEKEIVGEEGVIEKELNPYEKLLQSYPWLEQDRMKFMYSQPDKKKAKTDYISWRTEWAKVLFDYSKFAVLHILYIRELNSEHPFSNFTNRVEYIREIADELIDQKLAKWLSKKREKLRVFWKTLETFSDEIYDWAYELGKLEPIMVYELREATGQDFSTLPMEDLEEIFKILAKNRRASVMKLDDGELAFKIMLD